MAIDGLSMQDISLFGDAERFGIFGTSGLYSLSAGDGFTCAGSGTIDLSGKGLTFGDLTLGSGVGFFELPGLGNVGVDATLNIVPEPSTLVLLVMGSLIFAGIGWWRRRRK